MIVYKIKDNKIVGISRQANDYVLQANEYSSDVWYLKPFWNGTAVVESITQQEIDERAEQEADRLIEQNLNTREQDGEEFYIKVRNLAKKHYNLGNINQSQYTNIRVMLQSVLQPLKLGDWDIAQDNIILITRPSGNLGALYDFVKNNIDQYITAQTNSIAAKAAMQSKSLSSKPAIQTNSIVYKPEKKGSIFQNLLKWYRK